MFSRPGRQGSVSSKPEIGSEMKRTKSKNSGKGGSTCHEEDLKPKVLFKVPKEDAHIRNTKKSSLGLINKGKFDQFLDRLVEKTSKSHNKSSQLVMSSSQIGQK